MTYATANAVVPVKIEDDYGHPIFTVRVELAYAVEKEVYHGQVTKVYHILDQKIEPKYAQIMTPAQIEYAIGRAFKDIMAWREHA